MLKFLSFVRFLITEKTLYQPFHHVPQHLGLLLVGCFSSPNVRQKIFVDELLCSCYATSLIIRILVVGKKFPNEIQAILLGFAFGLGQRMPQYLQHPVGFS